MTNPDRLAAWDRIHAALERLPGRRASRPQYHAEVRLWQATALDGRQLGRGQAIEATGDTEAAAVLALAELLERPASAD